MPKVSKLKSTKACKTKVGAMCKTKVGAKVGAMCKTKTKAPPLNSESVYLFFERPQFLSHPAERLQIEAKAGSRSAR